MEISIPIIGLVGGGNGSYKQTHEILKRLAQAPSIVVPMIELTTRNQALSDPIPPNGNLAQTVAIFEREASQVEPDA